MLLVFANWQAIKIAAVVLLYWTISISMVFANKYLLGDQTSKLDVSIFMAWAQCVITVIFLLLVKLFVGIFKGDWSYVEFTSDGICQRRIQLLTCSYVSMLAFNNLCLRHVGIAFYQIARSMTLIFTVILSAVILNRAQSKIILLCCMAVAGGFILGTDQEHIAGTLAVRGVIFGVTSSFFIAVNGIMTKLALDAVNRDSVQLTFYNNINATLLLLPLVLLTGQMQQLASSDVVYDMFFWIFLVGTGILGFGIAWISAVQIDLTSPVTHHISANTKAVLQTLIAVAYFKETKSFLWWISICLVVGGAFSYAVIKIYQEQKPAEQTPAKSVSRNVDPINNELPDSKQKT